MVLSAHQNAFLQQNSMAAAFKQRLAVSAASTVIPSPSQPGGEKSVTNPNTDLAFLQQQQQQQQQLLQQQLQQQPYVPITCESTLSSIVSR